MLRAIFGGGRSSRVESPAPAISDAERFSLTHLSSLHATLERLRGAAPSYAIDDTIVDTVKQLSELMVYGDKHEDSGFFEFFCEKGLLRTLVELFRDQARTSAVRVQIIQSLSVLFINISSSSSLFYLLSNNHINDLISSRVDPSDEELLAYYVSFLKSLSLSLNEGTVHFFLQNYGGRKGRAEGASSSGNSDGAPNLGEHDVDATRPSASGVAGATKLPASDPKPPPGALLPLYTEALRFSHHGDSMVRATVRTLTLNVYNVDDAGVRSFLCAPGPHYAYHVQLAQHVRSSVLRISGLVAALGNLNRGQGAGAAFSSSGAASGDGQSAAQAGSAVDWPALFGGASRPTRGGSEVRRDHAGAPFPAASVATSDILAHSALGHGRGKGSGGSFGSGPGSSSTLTAHSTVTGSASSAPAFSSASGSTLSSPGLGGGGTGAHGDSAGGSGASGSAGMARDLQDALSEQLSELMTLLLYCQDILAVGQRELDSQEKGKPANASFLPVSDRLCDALLDAAVRPLLLHTLAAAAYPASVPADVEFVGAEVAGQQGDSHVGLAAHLYTGHPGTSSSGAVATVPFPGLVLAPGASPRRASADGNDPELANNPFLSGVVPLSTAGTDNPAAAPAVIINTGLPAAATAPIVIDPCLALCVLLHMSKAVTYARFVRAVNGALVRDRLAVPSPLLGEVPLSAYWALVGMKTVDAIAPAPVHPALAVPPVHPAFLKAAKRSSRRKGARSFASAQSNGFEGGGGGGGSSRAGGKRSMFPSLRARSSSASAVSAAPNATSQGGGSPRTDSSSLADAYDELATSLAEIDVGSAIAVGGEASAAGGAPASPAHLTAASESPSAPLTLDDSDDDEEEEEEGSPLPRLGLPSRFGLREVLLTLLQSPDSRLAAAAAGFLLGISRIPHIHSEGLIGMKLGQSCLGANGGTLAVTPERRASVSSAAHSTGPTRLRRPSHVDSTSGSNVDVLVEDALGLETRCTVSTASLDALLTGDGGVYGADGSAVLPQSASDAGGDTNAANLPSHHANDDAQSASSAESGSFRELLGALTVSLCRFPVMPKAHARFVAALLLRLAAASPHHAAVADTVRALESCLSAVSSVLVRRLDSSRASSPANAYLPLLHVLELCCEAEVKAPPSLPDALAVACEAAGVSFAAIDRDFCEDGDCLLESSDSTTGVQESPSRQRPMTGEQLKLQAAARETLRSYISAAVMPPCPLPRSTAHNELGGGNDGSDSQQSDDGSTSANPGQLLDDVSAILTPLPPAQAGGGSTGTLRLSCDLAAASPAHGSSAFVDSPTFQDAAEALLSLRGVLVALFAVRNCSNPAAWEARQRARPTEWLPLASSAMQSLIMLCRLPASASSHTAADLFASLTASVPIKTLTPTSPHAASNGSHPASSPTASGASSESPSFWDGIARTLCLDPLLRAVAPPLDSIRPGNSFSLQRLPWFSASVYPVVLDLPAPPIGPGHAGGGSGAASSGDPNGVLAPLAQAASAAAAALNGGAPGSATVSGSGSAFVPANGSPATTSAASGGDASGSAGSSAAAAAAAASARRVGVVLGSTYLVLADLLPARQVTAGGSGGGGEPSEPSTPTTAGLAQRGRALAVVPLHFTYTTVPLRAGHVVDVRFLTRSPVALARQIAVTTAAETRALDIAGFTLVLDSSELAAITAAHVEAARRRVLDAKHAATLAMLQGYR